MSSQIQIEINAVENTIFRSFRADKNSETAVETSKNIYFNFTLKILRNMKPCKQVAIIGGGFSGVMCIKELKEDGIEPVCFEKSPDIGGTWCYTDKIVEGRPSTMWTTIINHSKEMGAWSNYPPPAESPNYMKHFELYCYFKNFAKEFDLFRHVICNREVTDVSKAEDYEDTGKWRLVIKNTETEEVISQVFDGVLVCVGHITYPSVPYFPGIDKFCGKTLHSHSLKRIEPFSGQRVVVIGTGCSAMDAAVEISNVADQVYLSIRTPSWVISRVGPYGLPMDYALTRRYADVIQKLFPLSWCSNYLERNFIDTKFNHKLYGIYPKYPFLSRDPVINDGLPMKLLSGTIILKKDVSNFDKEGIFFEDDDEKLTKVDTVILATGYEWKFPFLGDDIITKDGNRINLYKCVFPPHLKYPTLAIIGFILPIGAGFPIIEIQIRWASYLMSGRGSLPSRQVMLEDIKARHERNSKRFSPSDKMSIRVDFIPYMDEIASQFGVKPNLWKMLFKDYILFKACVFGPCLPYQYRLEGHNKWNGARNAILTAHQRMREPLHQKRKRSRKNTQRQNATFKYAMAVTFLAYLIYSRETSIKYYFLAFVLPYFASLQSFSSKQFFVLLLLPFYVTCQKFLASYFITLFTLVFISMFMDS